MIDQEAWRSCPGFSKYEVSNLGRVRRIETSKCRRYGGGTLRKPYAAKGCAVLTLYMDADDGSRRNIGVNRLVLLAFAGAPPSPGHHAAHWDGDRFNNRLDNLRWATRSENEGDKVRHGRSNRGERQHMAKLTADDVRQIRRSLSEGKSQQSVATAFGVSRGAVQGIRRGQSWSWLS